MRVGNFIGGHEPWSQHRVAIGRFTLAAVFRAPNGHVKADAVAGYIIHRIVPRN